MSTIAMSSGLAASKPLPDGGRLALASGCLF